VNHNVMSSTGSDRAEDDESIYSVLEYQSSDVFYKNVGGKTACVELRGRLCKRDGERADDVGGVELDLVLLYENGDFVENQSICTVLAKHPLRTADDGRFIVNFRIDDISKNHQGKRFKMEIYPNHVGEIFGVCSDPITVLSKKPKKKKRPASALYTSRKDVVVDNDLLLNVLRKRWYFTEEGDGFQTRTCVGCDSTTTCCCETCPFYMLEHRDRVAMKKKKMMEARRRFS
jgi:hypothetical protein